jgi:hypothetical protein
MENHSNFNIAQDSCMDATKRASMYVIKRARKGGAGGGDQASGGAGGGVSLLIFKSTSSCYLILSNMHGF